MAHVGDGRRGADEDVLAERDAAPDAHVALDPRPPPDDGAVGHEGERADDVLGSELRARLRTMVGG